MRAVLFSSLLALLVALSTAFYVPREDLYASSFEKRARYYDFPTHEKREFSADDLTLRFGKRANFHPEDLALRFGRK